MKLNSAMKLKTLLLMIGIVVFTGLQLCHQAYAKMDSGNISMTVKNANIAELYEMLSRQHHVNILLSKGVTGEVSINLYNVTVQEAISSIATAAGYLVENRGNEYVIRVAAEAGKTMVGGLKQLKTFKIQYSNVTKVAEILKKYISPYGKVDVLVDRQIIVVEDLPEFVQQAEALLNQLDQAPAQVLIEARIYSIRLDDTQKLGIDWTKTFAGAGGKGNFGVENLGQQATNLAIGAAAGPPGLFFNYLNNNIEAQLTMLSNKEKVKTLATPKILALEQQESEVIIGARTGYKVTTTINQVTTETIQFLESGTILKVTPYIDRFGRIMMDIHPQVSAPSFRGLNSEIPSLTTTEVNTRLLVEDGQTIFIGGLIDNSVTSSHQGVPFLENIPYLGYLFASDKDVTQNTETIVLIKPQIVRPRNMSLLTESNTQVDNFNTISKQKSEKIDDFFKKNYMFRSK